MVFRILFILILASGCSAVAMYKPVHKPNRPIQEVTTKSETVLRTRALQTKISEEEKAISLKKKQMGYFKDLSKLETKLNGLVDKATDYPHTHNLIVLTIESNPVIKQEDKQELYNDYEEQLYKKFEHTFRKSPAQ